MAEKVEELGMTMVNKTVKTYYEEGAFPVSVADADSEKEAALMLKSIEYDDKGCKKC